MHSRLWFRLWLSFIWRLMPRWFMLWLRLRLTVSIMVNSDLSYAFTVSYLREAGIMERRSAAKLTFKYCKS